MLDIHNKYNVTNEQLTQGSNIKKKHNSYIDYIGTHDCDK